MQKPSSPSNSFLSPKRKRDVPESPLSDVPSPSRLRTTNLPTRPLIEREFDNEGSPRSTVAGHLQDLDLKSYNSIPQLDFSNPSGPGGKELDSQNPRDYNRKCNGPITPPPTSNGTFLIPTRTPSPPPQFEVPETPRLRPVSSPTPPPTNRKSVGSKSPTPSSPVQPLWWSDAEITGHDPKDPSDDGYGINGIGFLPTPAIASARLERRKRQVAEWKNREAKEARQKRSDRRRRRDIEAASLGNPMVRDDNVGMLEETRKVRFLEV